MRRQRSESAMRYAVIVAALACILAAGYGAASPSSTASRTSAPPSTPATTAQAASTPSPPPSPSEQICYTSSCIASAAQQQTGTVATDGSVITKMSCNASTVRHAAPGVFTVDCTATYSDGSQWYGITSVLTGSHTSWQLSWQPQYQT